MARVKPVNTSDVISLRRSNGQYVQQWLLNMSFFS